MAQRTLRLVKGNHTFAFKYEVGQEAELLKTLAEYVKRRDLPFDSFDAAVLAHQLGKHLLADLKALFPPPPNHPGFGQ